MIRLWLRTDDKIRAAIESELEDRMKERTNKIVLSSFNYKRNFVNVKSNAKQKPTARTEMNK